VFLSAARVEATVRSEIVLATRLLAIYLPRHWMGVSAIPAGRTTTN
jgi:hypothetical protein